MLEKISQCYDLLSVLAYAADPKRTKQVLEAHSAGLLLNEPGWRPPDASAE